MEPGTELFAQLMGAALMGGITSGVAVHKGRSALGWFFVGFLTGCIGLIVVCCLQNSREQKEVVESMQTEAAKLREQLKHERMRNESFQAHVRGRIDAHDEALGMDTKAVSSGRPPRPALGAGGGGPRAPRLEGPAPATAGPGAEAFSRCQWFVKFGERKSQALDFEKLKKFWEIGNLTVDTLVCNSEREEWVPISDVPGLLAQLRSQEFQT